MLIRKRIVNCPYFDGAWIDKIKLDHWIHNARAVLFLYLIEFIGQQYKKMFYFIAHVVR